MPLEKLFERLGRRDIPGTPDELARLSVRIEELAQLNGEEWIREHRDMLLAQWEKARCYLISADS